MDFVQFQIGCFLNILDCIVISFGVIFKLMFSFTFHVIGWVAGVWTETDKLEFVEIILALVLTPHL